MLTKNPIGKPIPYKIGEQVIPRIGPHRHHSCRVTGDSNGAPRQFVKVRCKLCDVSLLFDWHEVDGGTML